MSELITVAEYSDAFRSWLRVAPRAGWRERSHEELLERWLAWLAERFGDGVGSRKPEEFCETFSEFAGKSSEYRAESTLRFHIEKSCLLDRLIYGRQPLRLVPCPTHDGKWNGLSFVQDMCPHGCDVSLCGCTTGWLPTQRECQSFIARHQRLVINDDSSTMWLRHAEEVLDRMESLAF